MAVALSRRRLSSPWCVLLNILLVYVIYEICRLAFLWENWSMFSTDMTMAKFWRISSGGLLFDTSAILLTNSLYILLAFLPLDIHENRVYSAITKWVYVVVNSLAVIANLADTLFFPFNFQRSTALIFREFGNETNISQIVGMEIVHHWYFLLLVILLIFLFYKLYFHEKGVTVGQSHTWWRVKQCLMILISVPLVVCGVRGGAREALWPITMSYAQEFVSQPIETGIVLNTPFTLIRSIHVRSTPVPQFFPTEAALDSIYTPVHIPTNVGEKKRKNVVIIIVESLSREFVGSLNTHLENGQYGGYTTFIDSLLPHCLYFSDSFANATISIDAIPAVLASIPRMSNPFVLTPYALNKKNSLATTLGPLGYKTAFFHGANNESMGFQAFVRSIGFQEYYGRSEYDEDPRFDGDADFDGTWAIWDEPFLQYFCAKMNEMEEPFLTSLFTASSHHPFAIPEQYKDIYPDEGLHKLHKCVRYTDNALRHFFATAKEQDWYNNTIFVITADHASGKTTFDEYKSALGHFKIPILFFDPTGEMGVGEHEGIVQQIDVMPTILSYLGYDQPYIAFGIDVLSTPAADTWAFNWDPTPQFLQGDYLLQMTNDRISAMYNYHADPLLQHNILDSLSLHQPIEQKMKAFMQSTLTRMRNNEMTYTNN